VTNTIRVELELAKDTPTSMTFADAYAGLENIWYRFSADSDGNVELWATPNGFEFLARHFLKFARTQKVAGYHSHATLEFSDGPPMSAPELTIGVVERPESPE
jgi:hypothetical protein